MREWRAGARRYSPPTSTAVAILTFCDTKSSFSQQYSDCVSSLATWGIHQGMIGYAISIYLSTSGLKTNYHEIPLLILRRWEHEIQSLSIRQLA